MGSPVNMSKAVPPLRNIDVAAIPILVSYFIGGLVSAFTGVPTLVEDLLGERWGDVWVGMLLLGPIVNGVSFLVKDQWLGVWLRISGGMMIFASMLLFASALFIKFDWENFTPYIAAGFAGAALVHLVIDIRSMIIINRVARRMEGRS